jgi:hypothetical protein
MAPCFDWMALKKPNFMFDLTIKIKASISVGLKIIWEQ